MSDEGSNTLGLATSRVNGEADSRVEMLHAAVEAAQIAVQRVDDVLRVCCPVGVSVVFTRGNVAFHGVVVKHNFDGSVDVRVQEESKSRRVRAHQIRA